MIRYTAFDDVPLSDLLFDERGGAGDATSCHAADADGRALSSLVAILLIGGRPVLFAQARHQQGLHLGGRRTCE